MSQPATATAPAPQDKPVFLQPDPHTKKYEALFVEIDTGHQRSLGDLVHSITRLTGL